MPRGERAAQELKEFAEEHLAYEAEMLFASAQELAEGKHPQHITNALLESFTIHLRALIDFFWGQYPARKDDALAEDFFEHPSHWKEKKPDFPAALELARNRANKEIAHLTYERLNIKPEAKVWPVAEMANAMRSALIVFAKSADVGLLGTALSELKSDDAG